MFFLPSHYITMVTDYLLATLCYGYSALKYGHQLRIVGRYSKVRFPPQVLCSSGLWRWYRDCRGETQSSLGKTESDLVALDLEAFNREPSQGDNGIWWDMMGHDGTWWDMMGHDGTSSLRYGDGIPVSFNLIPFIRCHPGVLENGDMVGYHIYGYNAYVDRKNTTLWGYTGIKSKTSCNRVG